VESKKKVYNPKKSLIRVVLVSPYFYVPINCQFCEKPPCVTSCPERALEVDETGRIRIDKEKCIGCTWCFNACPFGAIVLDREENTVRICDLCDGEPECAKACPTGAIELATLEQVGGKNRILAAQKLISAQNLAGEILGGG